MTADIRSALETLRRSAEAETLALRTSGPGSDETIRARENGISPHFGTISWTVPPAFRAVLAVHNRLSCVREIDDFPTEFTIVDEQEIVELNADLVHMPEHVSRDEGRELSTNHLVGFAEAGGEAVWCFDITRPGDDGDYPVYYHHQDEPRARYSDDGAWEDLADAVPDFPSFAVWFTTMTEAFTADVPPDWCADLGSPSLRANFRTNPPPSPSS